MKIRLRLQFLSLIAIFISQLGKCQLNESSVGHKLEACFDPRQGPQSALALATVQLVNSAHNQVTVSYDGWPQHFEMDLSANSSCLHPVGFAAAHNITMKISLLPVTTDQINAKTVPLDQFTEVQKGSVKQSVLDPLNRTRSPLLITTLQLTSKNTQVEHKVSPFLSEQLQQTNPNSFIQKPVDHSEDIRKQNVTSPESGELIIWRPNEYLELEVHDYDSNGTQIAISVARVFDYDEKRARIGLDLGAQDLNQENVVFILSNSTQIHPVGFATHYKLRIHNPSGSNSIFPFDWTTYLRQRNSTSVPYELFNPEQTKDCPPFTLRSKASNINEWVMGMRLEALDPLRDRIRVASITQVDYDQAIVTVHFDGWPIHYKYAIHSTSTRLHPIGYCAQTGCDLQPPKESGPSVFVNWSYYLWRERAQAVPYHLFILAQTNGVTSYNQSYSMPIAIDDLSLWKVGMKFEAVNRMNGEWSVATVTQIYHKHGIIRLNYDGLSPYWDAELRPSDGTIKPIGYCETTNICVLSPPKGSPLPFTWQSYMGDEVESIKQWQWLHLFA